MRQLSYLDRLVVHGLQDVVVVGCGPRPHMLKVLLDRGYRAIGIEPMASFVEAADRYLGTSGKVLRGTAERLPLADASQDLVYCNSVLEHVDSPLQSLTEMQRVLRPGGIAFVITTNRYRFSLRGDNGEYSVPFFNWLPEVVKESFVFHHLHYRPELASYSERPAVHWYSFSDLCRIGRDAGFFQFYSTLDLVSPTDPTVAPSPLKRFVLPRVQQSPWLRAAVLWGTALGWHDHHAQGPSGRRRDSRCERRRDSRREWPWPGPCTWKPDGRCEWRCRGGPERHRRRGLSVSLQLAALAPGRRHPRKSGT